MSGLLKRTATYTLVNIISRGISFFLLPLYTSVLSPKDYGVLDLIFIFGYFVNLSIALEISQAVARFYPPEKDESRKILIASTAFWFSFVVYLGFTALFFLFSRQISILLFDKGDQEIFFQIGICYVFFNGLFMFVQNQFRWQQRSRMYALVSLIYTIFTAGISVLLAYHFKYGLIGILLGLSTGAAVGFFVGLPKLRKTLRFRFDKALLREMISFSIPLVPASLAVFISNYFDRIMINQFMTLSDVGIYGAAFRIASIVSFVIKGVSGAVTPYIFKNYQNPQTPQLISQIYRYYLCAILIIFVGLVGLAPEITRILTAPEYFEAHTLIIYLVPSIILTYMYLFTPGMSLAKKTKIILFINVFGAIVNIALNFILIPKLGISGAALATLIAYFLVFLLNIYFSQRYYYVPHKWMPLFIATALLTSLGYLGSTINTSTHQLSVFKGAVLFILSLAFLLLTKVVSYSDLIKFVKNFLSRIGFNKT